MKNDNKMGLYLMDIDSSILQELACTRMPFGKYKGRLLLELPEPYMVWFHGQGFPNNKLGQQLALVYELQLNGLSYLLSRFKPKR